MAFSNQCGGIITDSRDNIYVFLKTKRGIEMIYYDKLTGSIDKQVIVNECLEEFDVEIDEKDILYLIYQRIDGKIECLICKNGIWSDPQLIMNPEKKAYNLSLLYAQSNIQGFLCVPIENNNINYECFYCIKEGDKWENTMVGRVTRLDVLNPFVATYHRNHIILAYINIINGVEQIFIRSNSITNNTLSEEIQLTYSHNKKLYIDMIIVEKFINLVYCESYEGNYVVKHEKYKLGDKETEKISENIISNPSNCSYPTLVNYKGKLWTIWVENDNLMSAYSDDQGSTWSNPYVWTDSKKEIFARYKFVTNSLGYKKNYKLNYSFGKQYPDVAFMGFGKLDKAMEVPLKNKHQETSYDDNYHKSYFQNNKENIDMKYMESDDEIEDDAETEGENQSSFEDIRGKSRNKINNSDRKSNVGMSRSSDWNTGVIKTRTDKTQKAYDEIDRIKKEIDRIHGEIKDINSMIKRINNNDLNNSNKASNIENNEDFEDLKGKLESLSKRVQDIENYLIRRRRGFFLR